MPCLHHPLVTSKEGNIGSTSVNNSMEQLPGDKVYGYLAFAVVKLGDRIESFKFYFTPSIVSKCQFNMDSNVVNLMVGTTSKYFPDNNKDFVNYFILKIGAKSSLLDDSY